MEIQKVKEVLDFKGLLEDGLFAHGSIPTKQVKDFGSAFGAVYGVSIAKFYAFTLLEGALAITPVTDNEILTDETIRIKKNDVDKIAVKKGFFGTSLQIIFKDGKKKIYNIEGAGDIQEIVNRVN